MPALTLDRMLSFLGITVVLWCGTLEAGETANKLAFISCSVNTQARDGETPADVENILRDGSVKTKVAWVAKAIPGKILKLTFHFADLADAERVVIHYYRARRSYGIREIKAFAVDASGISQPVGFIAPNQPYDKPEDEPANASFELPLIAEGATEIRLEFSGYSFISLSGVEFFGAPRQAASPTAIKDIDLSALAGGDVFRVVEIDIDGQTALLLENPQVLYLIQPALGGVVNAVYDKIAKTNLVKRKSKGVFGGIFNDLLWPATYRGNNWVEAEYVWSVEKNTSDEIAIKLSAPGSQGILAGVTFDKTLTLRRDGAALRLDYRISNDLANVAPLDYGLWLHSSFDIADGGAVFNTHPGGVARTPFAIRGGRWEYNPTRPWYGAIDGADNGCGLIVDYKYIHGLYAEGGGSHDSAAPRVSTVECRYGIYPIDADGYFTTTLWVVPFHGVGLPESVTHDVAGRVDGPEQLAAPDEAKLKARLLGISPGRYQVKATMTRLPDGEAIQVYSGDVDLGINPTAVDFAVTPGQPGTYEVRFVVSRLGREAAVINRSLLVGEPSAFYAWIPSEERVPGAKDSQGKIDLNFKSTRVETEHVNWGKPYYGKRPKVLFIPDRRPGNRVAIELAQRFDIDFDVSLFYRMASPQWELGDYAPRLSKSDFGAHLTEMLRQNRYDCYVVPGGLWSHLGDNNSDEIIRRVRAGAGLVLIGPASGDFYGKIAETPNGKVVLREGRAKTSGSIVDAIPFELIPPAYISPVSTSLPVLAAAGDLPLVMAGDFDKGRLAAMAWFTLPKPNDKYFHDNGGFGFIPNRIISGVAGWDNQYWEYEYSLLARMIYWAAGDSFPITASEAKIASDEAGRQLSLMLQNAGANTVDAVLEATIRDRFGRIEKELEEPISLPQGEMSVTISLGEFSLAGRHGVDLRLKVNDKRAWWGGASFDVAPAASVVHVKSSKEIWKRDEICNIDIRLTGEIRQVDTVVVELRDAFDRVFAAAERPATESVAVDLPLTAGRGLTFAATARLLSRGVALDEKRIPLYFFAEMDKERLQIDYGWTSLAAVESWPPFLMKAYYGRLSELGATVAQIFRTLPGEFRIAREMGWKIHFSTAPMTPGGKHPNTTDPSKGKYGLIRNPCLSQAGFKEKLYQKNLGRGPYEEYGSLWRSLGDEINRVGTWEGCFCEACRDEFRHWLKDKYQTLERLNKEWETSFSDWKEVEGMTSAEARDHGSFAPWCDHRAFNDWNWHDSIRLIRKALDETQPETLLGASGTEGPSPFNGYDWWQLMKYFSGLSAYQKDEQSVMQRSFGKQFLWHPWAIGYIATLPEMRVANLRCLILGAQGFNVYSPRLAVNPDLELSRLGRDLRTMFDEFQNGTAEALIWADYESRPLAFLHSQASIRVNWLRGWEDARKEGVAGYRNLLFKINSDYDYIAYEQVANGELERLGYKLLYLPASSALSEQEAEGIRKFVENGGVVVADFAAGLYTDNGKKMMKPHLDDVFGINRNQAVVERGEAVFRGSGDSEGIDFSSLELMAAFFERGVATATAKSLGIVEWKGEQFPAAFVNRYGKGLAVYFGADIFSEFGRWKEMRYMKGKEAASERLKNLAANLENAAGMTPRLKVVAENGADLIGCESYAKTFGPGRIISVIRDEKAAAGVDNVKRQVDVSWFVPAHAYNLISKHYYGYSDHVAEEFFPTTNLTLALLPYRVSGVRATISMPEVARGNSVTLRFAVQADPSDAPLATHPLSVTVYHPDGVETAAYGDILRAEGGVAELAIPLALNDPIGSWRAVVMDAITGVKSEISFKVVEK